MKRNHLALRALASIAVAATAFLSQAQAAPVLSISLTPASDVAFGGAVGVDIFVSGLTDAMGGYAFDLNYDSGRMLFGSFLADPDTKMGDLANPALDISFGNAGASVNFNVLAGFTSPGDEATLAGLQGGGFRLGHVDFTALSSAGFASFDLTGYSLSNYDGSAAFRAVTATGARLCVGPAGSTVPCDQNVPEPMSGLLVAVALGGLALARRQAKAA